MEALTQLADTLCAASRRLRIDIHDELLRRFDAPLSRDQWFLPPELLSLYGTPAYEQLSEAQRKTLSFYETVNLFSFSANGESLQVQGLASRLYGKATTAITPYLHYFLEEENSHMAYFGQFCLKHAGKIYPSIYQRATSLGQEWPEEEDLVLFFVKLLVFEELGDAYNVRIAADASVCPLVRDINRLHHQDEARHLAFGRKTVQTLFQQYASHWSAESLRRFRAYVEDYFLASWAEFYSHRVYKDCGLAEPRELRQAVFAHPAALAHRQEISSRIVEFLRGIELLESAPALI